MGRGWDTFEKMPKGGFFDVEYMCSPEDRNFQFRQQCLEKYGCWSLDVAEEEVLWWAALSEAPEDVLEFLEFLTANFADVFEAFTAIDGVGGNGVITRKEFAEGYKEIGCKKFEGENELERINAVFRYLDPSGEGEVSRDEWAVLDQFWKEIKLSIHEFVSFCSRHFGEELANTWEFLDDDGSGEIDQDEWVEAIRKLGYFGPAV